MVDRNTSKQELLPLRQAEWGAAEGTDLFLVLFLSEIVLMWQQELFCWLVCLFESALLFSEVLDAASVLVGPKTGPMPQTFGSLPRPFSMLIK